MMRKPIALLSFSLALMSCAGGGGPTSQTAVLTSVAISGGSTITAGSTLSLSATPKDQNGGTIAATVTWSSSAPNVATVSGSGVVTAIAAGAATIAATATAGGASVQGSTQITVTPLPVLTSVAVSVPVSTITIGGTIQATALPKDQNGSAIPAIVTWNSSAPTVASVSASGLVTALAPGSATITASALAGGATVTGNVLVTVNALMLSVVTISGASNVNVGSTIALTASPLDQNGNAFAAAVTWSSGATGIATVNAATGVVTGVAAGAATITASATAGGVTKTAAVQITVVAIPVLTSVTVRPATTTINVADGTQLSVSPVDQNGNAIAATVTWSSSASSIASVTSNGLVTGVAAGTATITASATAGGVTKTGTATITVVAAPTPVLTSVTISGGTTVSAGLTLQLAASPKDQNGSAIAATVTWSSNATSIATVNSSTGLVTGVAPGTAIVTASATAGGVTKTANVLISVSSPYPNNASVTATTSITFDPTPVDIALNGSVNFIFQSVTHNVTFNSGAGVPADVGNTANATVSRTFTAAGTFNYRCTIHPGMSGSVIVH